MYRYILLALLVTVVSCTTSDHPSVSRTQANLQKDTTGKPDPLAFGKEMTNTQSPSESSVLSQARVNPLFDAEKWLADDRKFAHRKRPGQISDYDRIIKKMSRRYGFDWRLIAAQIYAESNFRNQAESHVGARGLMQIMPGTAKYLGVDPGKLTTPEVNIALGCRYNQKLYSLWGRQTKDPDSRLALALASYNAGRGTVLRRFSNDEGRTTWKTVHPPLPKETQMYVHKIYLKHDFYKSHLTP